LHSSSQISSSIMLVTLCIFIINDIHNVLSFLKKNIRLQIGLSGF
jgi:hypothetical protein